MTEAQILLIRSRLRVPFELTVSGVSMNPVLQNGDTVSVCSRDEYYPGDILVFVYKNSEILIHRLLKTEKGRYFCKGDNSFRIEDVEKDAIAGAITLQSDRNNNPSFISASSAIGGIFKKLGYSKEKTVQTPEYIDYKEKYLT